MFEVCKYKSDPQQVQISLPFWSLIEKHTVIANHARVCLALDVDASHILSNPNILFISNP